jgi:HAD superfamily hydrolase (TIGR01549 family)
VAAGGDYQRQRPPELFGLSDYFRFVLRAGPDGRSKPFADMYHLAAERLNLPLGQILHVGDDLTTDVAGAALWHAGLLDQTARRGPDAHRGQPPAAAY